MENEHLNLNEEVLKLAREGIANTEDKRVKYLSELQFEIYLKRWDKLKHRFIPYHILTIMFEQGGFDEHYHKIIAEHKAHGILAQDFEPKDAYGGVLDYLKQKSHRIAFFEHPMLISVFLKNFDKIRTCLHLRGYEVKDVIIGSIPDNRLDAKFVSLSENEHLIIVNDGYLHFFNFLLKILFGFRHAVLREDEDVIEQTVRLFADGFFSYITSDTVIADLNDFDNLHFYHNLQDLHLELMDVAITFVITHEYFHMAQSNTIMEFRRQATNVVKEHKLDEELIESLVNFHKESEIDSHASYITYMAFLNRLAPETINDGVALTFAINDLFMKFLNIKQGFLNPRTNTHPPAEARIMANQAWGEIIFERKIEDPIYVKELNSIYDLAYPKIVAKLREHYK